MDHGVPKNPEQPADDYDSRLAVLFADLMDRVQKGECQEFSAKQDAAERFEEERVEATKGTVWVSGCSSWYLDDRGIPAVWPWSMSRFRSVMAEPDMKDFEVA